MEVESIAASIFARKIFWQQQNLVHTLILLSAVAIFPEFRVKRD